MSFSPRGACAAGSFCFGDIDSNGNKVVQYWYDAWGNHKVVDSNGNAITNANHIGNLNPFRYRGYYYDRETGLYFLQTRYYDPEIGRFLNRDSVAYADPQTINGLNLYAYCLNNPIEYVDPSGSFPILAFILGVTAVAGLGLTIGGVASNNSTITAVGLSMVAVPALISGGLAISLSTSIGLAVGIPTVLAGAGTALFASAEIQQASGHGNWMLDLGIDDYLYNTLMLTTASLATEGVFLSNFAYSFKIASLDKIGKLIPSNHPNKGYPGVRFVDIRGSMKSIELQLHVPHGLHFQLNSWNTYNYSASSKRRWVILKWFFKHL